MAHNTVIEEFIYTLQRPFYSPTQSVGRIEKQNYVYNCCSAELLCKVKKTAKYSVS